jgi:hypothetical protein
VGYPLEKEEMVEEGELKLAVEKRTEKKKITREREMKRR